jgi:hypothetical protein
MRRVHSPHRNWIRKGLGLGLYSAPDLGKQSISWQRYHNSVFTSQRSCVMLQSSYYKSTTKCDKV